MKTERVKYLKVDQNVPHTKKKMKTAFGYSPNCFVLDANP